MHLLRSTFRELPSYLWSGWGAICSLLLLMAAWQLVSEYYGSLVLAQPLETFASFQHLWNDQTMPEALLITGRRALLGLLLALGLGTGLGLLAGVSVTAAMMSRPLVTVLLGMPPIAWLVLAMLWFGASDGTPIFTVFVATFPMVFIGALQGARTVDNQLNEMAQTLQLPKHMMLFDVYLPHVFSYLFPAWVAALGMSWKIVVMAELLANQDGVGASLAVARSHLDSAASMAWIVAIVLLLLGIEYLFLEPIKRQVERWRVTET